VVPLHRGDFGRRCLRCLSTPLHRAMGLVVAREDLGPEAAVYELSSRGALCRWLRKTFSRVTTSEYFDDVPPGASRDGVVCQDVQRLTFPDAIFDLVTSTEVFEHVPDDARAFREVRRVLRPGGRLVFTVPLNDAPGTLERARFEDGRLRHLVAPEYHDDRLRGRRRVLAFRTYGRDLLARLGAAGLDASFVPVRAPRHAVENATVVVGRRP
jgi:SAM-dependent methyltransferase